MRKLIFLTPLLLTRMVFAQGSGPGLTEAAITKPLSDQWVTYNGDYSGKRYSYLKNINTSTVKNLSLAWVANGITTGCGPTGNPPAGAAGPAMGGGGGGGRNAGPVG